MKSWSISVQSKGLAPIKFDRFFDQSKTQRAPAEKLYLADGIVVLPIDNIWAFLTCQRTGCARVFEGKSWMDYYRACQSFVRINPLDSSPIPFCDEKKKPIKFDNFEKLTYSFATNVLVGTGKNISRNTITRPVLRLPWNISFIISLFENEVITAQKIEEWFRVGGMVIGWGNGRPKFGRFEIVKWDVK